MSPAQFCKIFSLFSHLSRPSKSYVIWQLVRQLVHKVYYTRSSSIILAENQSYTETQSSSLRKLCVNPPDHISSPLVSVQCFSLQLCSSCGCDVLYVFVVIQPRSSVSISSIADIVQSKTRDDVIFTDLWIHYSRDLSLRLYRRLPRLFLLSGFINSSYS